MSLRDQMIEQRRKDPEQFVRDMKEMAQLNLLLNEDLGMQPDPATVEIANWDFDKKVAELRVQNREECEAIIDLMKEHDMTFADATELYDRMVGM